MSKQPVHPGYQSAQGSSGSLDVGGAESAKTHDSGMLSRSVKIALIAIAVSAAIFAAIHYTVGFSFVFSLIANNPIKTVVLLVVVAGVLWVVFRDKSASSEAQGRGQTTGANSSGKTEKFPTMSKLSLIEKLAVMRDNDLNAQFQSMKNELKTDYLIVLGTVNIDEYLKMAPTVKRQFCFVYQSKVVIQFTHLSNAYGCSNQTVNQYQEAAEKMVKDLEEYHAAEMHFIKTASGNGQVNRYPVEEADIYFKNYITPNYIKNQTNLMVASEKDLLVAKVVKQE